MVKALTIQVIHHGILLNCRNQERIVQSRYFVEAWDKSDKKVRRSILACIRKIQPEKIQKWINETLYEELERIPIAELRRIASYYQIKNYSRKSRLKLVSEIKGKRADEESRRKK